MEIIGLCIVLAALGFAMVWGENTRINAIARVTEAAAKAHGDAALEARVAALEALNGKGDER